MASDSWRSPLLTGPGFNLGFVRENNVNFFLDPIPLNRLLAVEDERQQVIQVINPQQIEPLMNLSASVTVARARHTM